MEINLPFRLKDINNYRNLKTENNRINLEKKKKRIYKNIKGIGIWDKDSKVIFDLKCSPLKSKCIEKPLSIINNYNKNQNIKSLNINNSEKDINDKKNIKNSLFEDEFYIDKLKNRKISYSINKNYNKKNKGDMNININNNNTNYFYLINKYRNKKKEIEKTHIISLPKVKKNNIPLDSFLDEKNFYINLNICLENFVNKYNKDAVDEFIKKQNKLFHFNLNNSLRAKMKKKYKKNEHNNSYNENNESSLKKMIHIEPIIINKNVKLYEYNNSYDKHFTVENNKFNSSFTKDNNNNKKKNIILPNLIKQHKSISNDKNKIIYRQTFNFTHSQINKNVNNKSEIIQDNNNNLHNKKYTILHSISVNSNLDKSKSLFSSPKNDKNEVIKKYKFQFNNKLNRLLNEAPPPNFYSKDFYYYNIFPQNCGWLIKKCFSHRKKWKECHSNNTNLFDFKWRDVVTIKDFIDFSISKKQMINHLKIIHVYQINIKCFIIFLNIVKIIVLMYLNMYHLL